MKVRKEPYTSIYTHAHTHGHTISVTTHTNKLLKHTQERSLPRHRTQELADRYVE